MLIRKTDWSIRNASPDDHGPLADFIGGNAWADAENSGELYRWKYQREEGGEALALVAVNARHDIVASSMFMPWTFCVNDRTLPACQWVDLFVALEYRGQAIADLTLQEGLVQTRRSGRPICFAFPNAHSVPVHKRAKGTHLGLIVRYAKPLRSEYLIRRKVSSERAARLLSHVVDAGLRLISKETFMAARGVQQVDACGPAFDELWRRYQTAERGLMVTRKDAAYLTWKYLRSPAGSRRLFARSAGECVEGWIVLEFAEDTGFIIDLLATSETVLHELIAFGLNTFRKAGLQSAAFVALENNRYFPAFRRFGFVPRSEPKHLYVYFDDLLADVDHLKQSSNWFITIGDCDIDHM